MGVAHKFSFFLLQWAILIGPSPKKTESWEAPENSNFYVRMECLPFGSAIIQVRRGVNFRQRIWDNVSYYWEHPWGTDCELAKHHGELIENLRNIIGNMMRTHELKSSILTPQDSVLKNKNIPIYSEWFSILPHNCFLGENFNTFTDESWCHDPWLVRKMPKLWVKSLKTKTMHSTIDFDCEKLTYLEKFKSFP
jgi:hypothetical protein